MMNMNQRTYYQNNIMIVNDDPDLVNSLQELFVSNGFQVITADNGRKCLLELEKGFQGIIILNIKTSVLNSIETIRRIRDEGFTNQNTIIMLTPKCILGEEFDEIYPYIYDLIFKPFDNDAVLNTIKKIAQQSPPKKRP
jgi:DNA-binding response OmpR family regulator